MDRKLQKFRTYSSLSLKLFEEAIHASVVFLNLIEAIFKFDFFIEQVSKGQRVGSEY